MLRHVKKIIIAFAFAGLTLNANAAELAAPKLYAVYFTAEWCPSCKVLGPNYAKAREEGKLDAKDVLFLKLDLTDKTSIHQSVLLASAVGIGPYVQKQGSSTGYVALLAADKTTELARFDRSTSSADIIAAIEKHLNEPAKK